MSERIGNSNWLDARLSLGQPIRVETHVSQGRTPIVIRAPQFDRAVYSVGDAFIYELVLENAGTSALTFPSGIDDDYVARDMPGATLAVIGLSFVDKALGPQVLGTQILAGAEPLAGTLIVVQPGERVRIRAGGMWSMSRPSKSSTTDNWPRSFQVKATVQIVGYGLTHFVGESGQAASVLVQK